MAAYKTLITTSGVGSRLGTSTKYTNKALVTVGDRAALSFIIEAYPDDVEIVITTGYYGTHIKDYVSLAYPNKNITFVEVQNYDGPGSSLVHSMLCAREHLQCPFVFHACDTIMLDPIPPPDYNWLGGFIGDESADYRTLKVSTGDVLSICEKGEETFDSIYIGLAGIKDWETFWRIAETKNDGDMQLSDCNIVQQMITDDITFKHITFEKWFDIGNIKCLQKARKYFKKSYNILDKEEESLNVFDDYVIKFFHNPDIVEKRVKRSSILHGKVPDIVGYRDNFYKYKKVQGEVLSKNVTENIFSHLLEWSMESLWSNVKESDEFYDNCKEFYYDKTISRLDAFKRKTGRKDKLEFINECEVPSAHDLLAAIPEDCLCSRTGYSFHGDFILSNIIYNNGSFTLIDWRQDFSNNIEYGDVYYDLSKLAHNLVIDHATVGKELYDISVSPSNIRVDIMRRDLLCKLEEILFEFIDSKGFDRKKVNILRPLIWINMSALHTYPLNIFLYYFGRYNLYRVLRLYKYI